MPPALVLSCAPRRRSERRLFSFPHELDTAGGEEKSRGESLVQGFEEVIWSMVLVRGSDYYFEYGYYDLV